MMRKILLYFTVMICSHSIFASEKIGDIEFEEFLLEPYIRVTETSAITPQRQTGLRLGTTLLGVKWNLSRSISGRLQLSQLDLLGPGQWTSTPINGYGFSEAYGQIESQFGRARAGLLPVLFGIEGSQPEALRLYPLIKIYENRRIPRRDYGLQYSISHNGFYTDATLHNGETADDSDERLFHTMRFGWKGLAGLNVGVSGLTGRHLSSLGRETRHRAGGIYSGLDLYSVKARAEFILGEEKTLSLREQFYNWYFGLRHGLGPQWGLLTRYEEYDADIYVRDNESQQWLLGLYTSNVTETSTLFFYGIKNWEATNNIPNDEVRIVWRLTSFYGDAP